MECPHCNREIGDELWKPATRHPLTIALSHLQRQLAIVGRMIADLEQFEGPKRGRPPKNTKKPR